MRNDNDTIYLQPGAQVTVDGGEAGKLTIKTASPTWNTDKPTKEGWYWARTSGKPVDETEIVRLTWMRGIDDQADAQDALVVHFNPGGWPFAHDVMKGIPLDELEGEWYGPLEVPE